MQRKHVIIASPIGDSEIGLEVYDDVKAALDSLVKRFGPLRGSSRERARLVVEGSLTRDGGLFSFESSTDGGVTFSFESSTDGGVTSYYLIPATVNVK